MMDDTSYLFLLGKEADKRPMNDGDNGHDDQGRIGYEDCILAELAQDQSIGKAKWLRQLRQLTNLPIQSSDFY